MTKITRPIFHMIEIGKKYRFILDPNDNGVGEDIKNKSGKIFVVVGDYDHDVYDYVVAPKKDYKWDEELLVKKTELFEVNILNE